LADSDIPGLLITAERLTLMIGESVLWGLEVVFAEDVESGEKGSDALYLEVSMALGIGKV